MAWLTLRGLAQRTGCSDECLMRGQCSTFSRLIPIMLLGVNLHGTSDKLFDSYLQEYMWKKHHKGMFI